MKTVDEIIEDIAEELAKQDGVTIEDIANQVLPYEVSYEGDSIFSVIQPSYQPR